MELSLVRSLMDREFYEDHRGAKCPDRLFSKDVRKIKQAIDSAMDRYERTVTPDEIEALFMSNNPTLTTAQKNAYSSLFNQIKKEAPMGSDVAQEVLSKLFQQVVGEDIANLGFDYVNGTKGSLEPLRDILERYSDDFTPDLRIEWDDIDIETLLAKNDLESQWTFNIPTLTRKVEGINAGHLIEVGARPNTGKCLRKGTTVILANGQCKRVEHIRVGDKLQGVDGAADTTVLGLGNGTEQHYRVRLRDGSYFDCNASHILSLKRKKTEGKHRHGDILNVPIEEYIAWPEGRKQRYSAWRSATVGVVKKLPIDPYLLGAWLGDGTSTKPNFTISEQALVVTLAWIIEDQYDNLTLSCDEYAKLSYTVIGKEKRCDRFGNKNGFSESLRGLSLYGNKHIPETYYTSTADVRLRLLAGLLDTDGHYANGMYEITQKNETLAKGIVRLAHSLGMACTIKPCKKKAQTGVEGAYFRMRISPGKTWVPCVLDRKRHMPNENTKDSSMQSFTVEPIGEHEYYGFELDGNHLFMTGNNIVTHNTSFHASLIAAPGGFAHQGARCVILCNEEASHRVGARYLTAATGMTMQEVKDNPARARDAYSVVADNIKIKDASDRDMAWVESVCKSYKPDILILDMGDKFARTSGFSRPDEALKANAIYARQIAKAHNCAIFYMSQLSADAEGKVLLNQSMMEGSRTGKAAEADLMVLIAKNPVVDGQEEEDTQRHLNVVKNKLSGWHGVVHCDLEYKTARYTV